MSARTEIGGDVAERIEIDPRELEQLQGAGLLQREHLLRRACVLPDDARDDAFFRGHVSAEVLQALRRIQLVAEPIARREHGNVNVLTHGRDRRGE